MLSTGDSPRPLVTVLVPCYNAAAYLPAMLASLGAQTTASFDVVFVDDGSTDDTFAIVSDFAARRSGAVVVRREANRGVCHTLNQGLTYVSTEFTIVFAADDIMLPDLVQDALETIARLGPNGVAAALPHYAGDADGNQRLDEHGAAIAVVPPAGVELVEPPGLLPLLLVGNRFAGVGIFRTKVIVGLGYDESLKMEDWDMWCRLAAAHRIGVAEKPLFLYRNTPSSLDKLLKQSGQRYVTGASIRAKFVGDGGPIDAAVIARTRVELNILITAGLRSEAAQVLRTLEGAGLPAAFRRQRLMMLFPTRVLRTAAAVPQLTRRLLRR